MQLICIFVFTYAKSRFSHDAVHTIVSCATCDHEWNVDKPAVVVQHFVQADHYHFVMFKDHCTRPTLAGIKG